MKTKKKKLSANMNEHQKLKPLVLIRNKNSTSLKDVLSVKMDFGFNKKI